MITPIQYIYPFLEISILIILAKIIKIQLNKIKIPGVVGEIIIGMIISPFLLGGIIDNILKINLFSLNNYLVFLAQLSVILIVFSTTLKFSVSSLKNAGIYGFLAALFGTLLSFTATFLIFYKSLGLAEDLIISTSVGITGLPAVSSILSEEYFNKSKEIDFLLNTAAIDDIIDLVLLSIAIGISLSIINSVYQIAKIVIFYSILFIVFTIIIITIVPRIINKVKDNFIEEFTFLLLFIIIASMVVLGFSSVIAAFLVGIAIADSIKKEKVINFIEKLLPIFGPIFFITVGMQANLTKLSLDILFFSLQLTGIALLFKFLGTFPFAFAKLKDIKKSMLVSIGMLPRGGMGVLVASIGFSLGLLDNYGFISAIFMSIFTTIIGAILFNKVWNNLKLEKTN
ncbi:sodium:proton antiporter [Nanoarchaeota archaeon]